MALYCDVLISDCFMIQHHKILRFEYILYYLRVGFKTVSQFIPRWALNENIQFSEGDQVKLKEDNVFSKTMRYYHENIEEFERGNNYDCKELCRQLVLNEQPLETTLGTATNPYGLMRFGEDWSRKTKINSSELQFGKTFSYWSYTPPLGDHAAIFFGKDQSGKEYYFSKNGLGGPLVITTLSQLKETYSLWGMFKTDYKKNEN
ncbi:hypothetical protein CRP01_40425 [Flavilitoribacter nigricans DSM 23189 = NBRC 102662]|uniref:Uncharacterized protein n=1 Tax=Flavilitoribacter nigricans (strain ATCC 23147 / DSM 23189 / NBRC 102662 / NCIMB 1420 / SS-2) TaxID=1122177 RepID=A0A2D0MXA2_FLAN2|nr:hypothetical protein CRP01_40425 [Flavilitoribacter nigricans DSM 23189 = NBRC 102662]